MGAFKLFTESDTDLFGFDDLKVDPPEDDGDKPIVAFSVEWMMDVLARKKIDGRIKPAHAMLDKAVWGDGVGAVRLRLTPNITAYVERAIDDLRGERVWVCKGVYKPDLRGYAGREEFVAHDLFDKVAQAYAQRIDSAGPYDWLINLTRRMTNRVRSHAPNMFVYQSVKEVNKDYYIIHFALRGAGVGKLASRVRQVTQTPELTIDLAHDKARGLIHVIVTTVSIGGEGDDWTPDIPYLDCFYAPSQDKDEIINSVLSAIRHF